MVHANAEHEQEDTEHEGDHHHDDALPPLIAFVRDAREVLLEHVLPFLADEDIAGLLGSHRFLSDGDRGIWRRRLAELLTSVGEDDGEMNDEGSKTAAGWKRAYRACSLSSRLYEGRLELHDGELPWCPGVFEVDGASFFVETRSGVKLFDTSTGKCIRAFVSRDIFTDRAPGLRIMYPLDRRTCLASTVDGDGFSLWDMVKCEQLHNFEESSIKGRSRLIKMNGMQFVRCSLNPDHTKTVEVWNFVECVLTCMFTVDLERRGCRVERLSNSLLSATSHAGRMALWDVDNGECVFDVSKAHECNEAVQVACSDDGACLIALHDDEVNIWCIKTETCIKSFRLGFDPCYDPITIGVLCESLCVSVDANQDIVKIWSTKDGSGVHENRVDTAGSDELNFGELTKLSSVSYATEVDGVIQLWKLPMALVHQRHH